ncbi:hypothetical protein QN359_18025 [Undibacterium sp. 5I2]|nr:hypothetical protein [Undibacterium sp. 5I2]
MKDIDRAEKRTTASDMKIASKLLMPSMGRDLNTDQYRFNVVQRLESKNRRLFRIGNTVDQPPPLVTDSEMNNKFQRPTIFSM